MFELILIIIIAIVFARASKNKTTSPLLWAIIGIVYYFIGRLISSSILYLIFTFYQPSNMSLINFYFNRMLLDISVGMLFGSVTAYTLGEISGLNIKRALNRK